MKIENPDNEATSMIENSLLEGHVVKDRWQVISKIGQGAFGQVYKCKDFRTKTEVALKLFCKGSKQSSSSLLKLEVQVLKDLKGKNFFPSFIGYGKTERFDYLVMELLGENLQQIRKKQTLKKFTLSTGIRLAQMMLESIQNIHTAGFVHQDIKPANFAIGLGSSARKLVIIDFSMARKFLNGNGELIPPRRKVNYKGTPRYSSVNVLLCNEPGRGDDLISLFYSLYELLVDDLPWKKEKDPQQIFNTHRYWKKFINQYQIPTGTGKNDTGSSKGDTGTSKNDTGSNLANIKSNYKYGDLLGSLPSEFRNFYEYVNSLRYDEEPDYHRLLSAFESIKSRRAIKDNEQFDFEMEKDETRMLRHSKSSPSILGRKNSDEQPNLKSSTQTSSMQSLVGDSSQAQQGIPLSWSCPTFSLFIRSNLRPPLKQLASINESVYEVDVRRNVAAKQTEDNSLVDGRRNSLPYLLDVEHDKKVSTQTDEKLNSSVMKDIQVKEINNSEKETKSMSISENSNYSSSPIRLNQDNEQLYCNNTVISSLSEKIIEFLVEEHSLTNRMCLQQDIFKIDDTNDSSESKNIPTKCQNSSLRRHRVNSENKYAKDESELNLHFKRRQRTYILSNDENNRILQTLNSNESNFSDRTRLQEKHELYQSNEHSKRMRYRRAVTSAIYS